MSAYICSPETFATLAVYAHSPRCSAVVTEWRGNNGIETVRRCAAELARENIRSVRARYPTGELPGPCLSEADIIAAAEEWAGHYYFTSHSTRDPVSILVLCQSYDYQSCETDDWRDTLAWRQIDWIRGRAIRALPGASDRPSEINDDRVPLKVRALYEKVPL